MIIFTFVNIDRLRTIYDIPSSGVVAVTVVLNGPCPTLVCAAMLQVYDTNGLSNSKRNDVPEKTICVILIPSSDVILMVYAVTMPFLYCISGGSQLIDNEVELSAVITKFWGAPLGTAKMKNKSCQLCIKTVVQRLTLLY